MSENKTTGGNRYDMHVDYGGAEMIRGDYGEWVLFEDHKKTNVDLLKALEELVEAVEYVDSGVYSDQISSARVAIAKAKREFA